MFKLKPLILLYYVCFLNFFYFSYETKAQQLGVQPLELENGWENWLEKIPASGSPLVGLMVKENSKINNPKKFNVFIPKTQLKYLRVEIKSKDGRYTAKINYEISKLKKGVTKFHLPTKYEEKLKLYTSDQIAILAFLSDSLLGPSSFYLLSSWNTEKVGNQVKVLVLYPRKAEIKIHLKNGKQLQLPFEPLPDPNVHFNQICNVSYSYLTLRSSIWISITKLVGGRREFKIIDFPIMI